MTTTYTNIIGGSYEQTICQVLITIGGIVWYCQILFVSLCWRSGVW